MMCIMMIGGGGWGAQVHEIARSYFASNCVANNIYMYTYNSGWVVCGFRLPVCVCLCLSVCVCLLTVTEAEVFFFFVVVCCCCLLCRSDDRVRLSMRFEVVVCCTHHKPQHRCCGAAARAHRREKVCEVLGGVCSSLSSLCAVSFSSAALYSCCLAVLNPKARRRRARARLHRGALRA